MNNDLSTFYRRLRYLQEWISFSVDNRVQRLYFEGVLQSCGIDPPRFPSEGVCIYEDFEGYCACAERDRRQILGISS